MFVNKARRNRNEKGDERRPNQKRYRGQPTEQHDNANINKAVKTVEIIHEQGEVKSYYIFCTYFINMCAFL